MKKVSYSDLFFDWDNSLNYMKKIILKLIQSVFLVVILHQIIKNFGDLGIKYIFHSAPSNLI